MFILFSADFTGANTPLQVYIHWLENSVQIIFTSYAVLGLLKNPATSEINQLFIFRKLKGNGVPKSRNNSNNSANFRGNEVDIIFIIILLLSSSY